MRQEVLAPQVQLVPLVLKVLQDLREPLVLQALLDLLVQQGLLGQQVRLVLRVRQVLALRRCQMS